MTPRRVARVQIYLCNAYKIPKSLQKILLLKYSTNFPYSDYSNTTTYNNLIHWISTTSRAKEQASTIVTTYLLLNYLRVV
jgi:hypothetical protein